MDLKLNPSDFDENRNIKASSLLHVFQEAASRHADSCGMGHDDMIKRDLIWVVTKVKFRMLSPLKPEGTYHLVTCPKPRKSVIYQREYYIYDEKEEPIVLGSSQWCFLNCKTRRIERVALEFEGEYSTDVPFPEGFGRIHPGELAPVGSHIVTEADLDANDHTNNCRYVDLVSHALGRQSIPELTITFSKETRLGDEICLFLSPMPDQTIVCGKFPNGDPIFSASVFSSDKERQ